MSFDRFIRDFVAVERSQAETLRSYGVPDAAATIERVASKLEEAFQRWWLESIPVAAAAEESGYTAGHIRQLAKDGTIISVGQGNDIRVQRSSLPRRPEPVTANSPGSPGRIEELHRRLEARGLKAGLARRR